MRKQTRAKWFRAGILLTLAMIAVLTFSPGARASAPPTVDGLLYGTADPDVDDYTLLVEQPNVGRIYYYLDGTALYVAVEALRDVNDNVFSDLTGSNTPDVLYSQSAGWSGNGSQHNFRALLLSEHAEIRFVCADGAIDESWIHGYLYDADLDVDPGEADWLSGTGDNSIGGPPPTEVTLVATASSLMWNLNNYASGGTPGWDITLGGARTTIDDYKSPGDGALDDDVTDEVGYPAVGDITFDTANGWEWPVIYEFQLDITNCDGTPFNIEVLSLHNSPSKGDFEDNPVSTTDYGDLPDSYGTSDTDPLDQQDGAFHTILVGAPNPILGTQIDFEADGQPTADATGDDDAVVDDEDGVVFTGDWTDGDGHIQITVNGLSMSGPNTPLVDVDACFNFWLDFANNQGNVVMDGDGDFFDSALGADEHAVLNLAVSSTDPQPINITFPLPPDLSPLTTVPVRARLTPRDALGGCSGAAYLGGAAVSINEATGGEIEDYLIEQIPAAVDLVTVDTAGRTGVVTVGVVAGLLLLTLATAFKFAVRQRG